LFPYYYIKNQNRYTADRLRLIFVLLLGVQQLRPDENQAIAVLNTKRAGENRGTIEPKGQMTNDI